MDIASNPNLTTQTAKSFATTAWRFSKLYGGRAIRIYRPENGGIRELYSVNSAGLIQWKVGRLLTPVGGISDTAPMAAANSHGPDSDYERMALYYIAMDNHLRSLIWFDHKWTQSDLDVSLGNEVCTGLHATWHKDKKSNLVWMICYTVSGKMFFRREIRNDPNSKPIVEEGTVNLRSGKPLTLVVDAEPDYDAVILSTGSGYRGNSGTAPEFISLPFQLGPVHRIASISCDPEREMRFFVTENNIINQYTLDRTTSTFSSPLPVVPVGKVAMGGLITTTAWKSDTVTIFAFFLYSGDNIGYCRYDYSNKSLAPHAHAVQT
ncbi:hypothetical protein FRB95_014516 [Tulasnella sp. JGI-2019a]|nr:hypothetical protein FRB95_014516 [Tulasnella sp. JGI-2019a]